VGHCPTSQMAGLAWHHGKQVVGDSWGPVMNGTTTSELCRSCDGVIVFVTQLCYATTTMTVRMAVASRLPHSPDPPLRPTVPPALVRPPPPPTAIRVSKTLLPPAHGSHHTRGLPPVSAH
jgi:hypothetical protein